MSIFYSRHRNFLFIILASLIILINYIIYNLSSLSPLPSGAVFGSLIDFLIVIPLLAYFFIIRKKYSLISVGIVILAAYGIAYLIIPTHYLSRFPFVPYLIGIAEGAFILLELYILYKVLRALPKMIQEYKEISNVNSYYLYNVKSSVEKHMPNNRAVHVFLSEITMFYYSLFCWRKKVRISMGQPFTYHKKTSVLAVYIMLIHATILESVGLHYFIHQWNEIVAYVLLVLNIYAILYFLAEMQAIRLSPFLLKDDSLYLQVGISKTLDLPLGQIKELRYYDGPEKISKQEKNIVFDARVADFFIEKPTFEIILKEPQTLHLLYGLTREVERIFLNVDNADEFFSALQKKMEA